MANYAAEMNRTFHALSDPTRRLVIQSLTERDGVSVKELAAPSTVGLPTFLKHLRVLEDSGLVSSTKAGRVRTCHLETRKLDEAEQWLAQRRRAVESQLDSFTEYVEEIHRTQHNKGEHT